MSDPFQDVPKLLDEIRRHERARRFRSRVICPIWVMAWLAQVVMIAIFTGTGHKYPSEGALAAGFLGLFVPLLLILPFPKHKKVMKCLSEIDDLRAVGPLIEAQSGQNDHASEVAVVTALTRLLPRLKTSDSALLSAKQLERLEKILVVSRTVRNDGYGSEFSVAVIRALEHVGSQNVVEVLEAVATGKARTANPAMEIGRAHVRTPVT